MPSPATKEISGGNRLDFSTDYMLYVEEPIKLAPCNLVQSHVLGGSAQNS